MKITFLFLILIFSFLPFFRSRIQAKTVIPPVCEDSLFLRAEDHSAAGDYRQAAVIYSGLIKSNAEAYRTIYDLHIEDLRNHYKVDELLLEHQKEKNKLLYYVLFFLILLVSVSLTFFLFLRISNHKLKASLGEMARAKREAEEAVRNKSLFLSGMTHEIRTPLNSITGFADLLANYDLDEETYRQCNDLIQFNSQLLTKLFDDVIDTTCFNPSEVSLKTDRVDAVSLCNGVVGSVRQIRKTEVPILFTCDYPRMMIETDTQRLQQVIGNLLVNAVKFTKEGSILLKLDKTPQGDALFSVTDTGSGIPEALHGKLFGRYEKLHEHENGTGLGLFICQTLIGRLGGEIRIDPAYKTGARFIFTHPAKANKSI